MLIGIDPPLSNRNDDDVTSPNVCSTLNNGTIVPSLIAALSHRHNNDLNVFK